METPPYFEAAQSWRVAYPAAHVGVLVMLDAVNPSGHHELERRRTALEQELRERYAGSDRRAMLERPALKAYQDYYRRFSKSYHVQLQLESVVFKEKPIPSGAGLVEAMFMAELDNLLLTAGHDLDALRLPLTLDVAQGTESYVLMRGAPQTPKRGDMMISDREGIVSSIVHGPDQRTQITPQTRNVVFTVYVPAGIGADSLRKHLGDLERNVRLIASAARVDLMEIYGP
jgi:DNA/RNA-binding domain of Phe-tRNA-synthetase-like protein